MTPDSFSSTEADLDATGRATTTDEGPIWIVCTNTDAASDDGTAEARGITDTTADADDDGAAKMDVADPSRTTPVPEAETEADA